MLLVRDDVRHLVDLCEIPQVDLLDADLGDGPHLAPRPLLPHLDVVQLEDVGVHLPPDVLEPLHDADRHGQGQRQDDVADGDWWMDNFQLVH